MARADIKEISSILKIQEADREVSISIREVENRKQNIMNGMAAEMHEDDLVTFDDHLESKICHVDAETKQEGDDEEVDDRKNDGDETNEYGIDSDDEE